MRGIIGAKKVHLDTGVLLPVPGEDRPRRVALCGRAVWRPVGISWGIVREGSKCKICARLAEQAA